MFVNFFIAALASCFSLFAVVVIGYISMSTGIGPWIELVVALLVLPCARLFCVKKDIKKGAALIGLSAAAAGIGGITATAYGFTLPTLYFLDKNLFLSWLSQPLYFFLITAGLVLVSGLFSFAITTLFGDALLADPKMPFPIGQLVARVIGAQQSLRQSLELVLGMMVTSVYYVLNLLCGFSSTIVLFIGRAWTYIRVPTIAIQFDQFAIFVAIGFIAGEILLVPLIIGVISQLFLVGPLHTLFFPKLPFTDFLFAFGAGLVLQEAAFGFSKLPKTFRLAIMGIKGRVGVKKGILSTLSASWRIIGIAVTAVLGFMLYFCYFEFSLISQLYILLFSIVCIYQLLLIGGKAGLAPLGRFATYVMLPGAMLFGFNHVQVTIVSLFVSLAGGMAVDIMFGRKMAQESGISRRDLTFYQVLGLVITACVTGIIFWLLISHFGIGSVELPGQRARARAILVMAFHFDYIALLLGAAFGVVLHFFKINTALIFTGLIFPIAQSLMLVLGGAIAACVKDRQRWEPFWSGVFAAGALWMLMRVFI